MKPEHFREIVIEKCCECELHCNMYRIKVYMY